MQLKGSNILITGASSGIGAATAEHLAELGATVGIVARRRANLEGVLERCRSHAPASRMWVSDLADLDAAEQVALDAWEAFGTVDVLVNNAGMPKRRAVSDLLPGEIEQVMRVNFHSPTRMTLALLPKWLDRDDGMVVNVASVGGRLGIMHEAAYCASKFALCGWSESLALDLWRTGVDVRLIIPGAFRTEIWDQPGNDAALYKGPLEDPRVAATAIAAAIEGDAFETYVPADMKGVSEFKTTDIDTFLDSAVAAMLEGGGA